MANKLGLTRDQLASFLKDPEQIKQFERLFNTVDQTVTVILPAVDTDAGISEAASYEALAEIQSRTQSINEQIVALQAQDNAMYAAVADLNQRIDGIESRGDGELLAAMQLMRNDIDALSVISMIQSPPKRRRLGNFYDTTTQTAAAINTAYAITFNTTDLSDGVYIGSPTSRIYVDTEAVYNFQFSAQLDNTSGGNHLVFIWYRVNGSDIANSASQVRLKGTDGELVSAWNFAVKLKAGDYFELMWSVTDTAVQVVAQAAAAPVPAIPSAILSVITAD
jgi:hypothetical protein